MNIFIYNDVFIYIEALIFKKFFSLGEKYKEFRYIHVNNYTTNDLHNLQNEIFICDDNRFVSFFSKYNYPL